MMVAESPREGSRGKRHARSWPRRHIIALAGVAALALLWWTVRSILSLHGHAAKWRTLAKEFELAVDRQSSVPMSD